jgi:glycosyltransferase involved in cell wall biosynthesis
MTSPVGNGTPASAAKKPYVVACIPAHNEESNIARVIIKAGHHVDRVIVCDDGSTDLTAEIASRLGAVVLRHEKNIGYGASIATLFNFALGSPVDAMVTIDADGQHEADDIPRILEPLAEGKADIVIGSRFLGCGEVPNHRKAGIKIINEVAKSGSYDGITDTQSGLRAYNRRAIQLIRPTESGMGASTEILIKAKSNSLRVAEVPIAVSYGEVRSIDAGAVRQGGSVVLNTIKHLSIERPVLFYGLPGLAFLIIGLVFGSWAIGIYLDYKYVPPNLAFIAIGSILMAVLFLMITVILWVLISVVREGRR